MADASEHYYPPSPELAQSDTVDSLLEAIDRRVGSLDVASAGFRYDEQNSTLGDDPARLRIWQMDVDPDREGEIARVDVRPARYAFEAPADDHGTYYRFYRIQGGVWLTKEFGVASSGVSMEEFRDAQGAVDWDKWHAAVAQRRRETRERDYAEGNGRVTEQEAQDLLALLQHARIDSERQRGLRMLRREDRQRQRLLDRHETADRIGSVLRRFWSRLLP